MKTSDDAKPIAAFPKRTPRKQNLPHCAPSGEDLAPGRIFVLDFGMAGSCNPLGQLQSSFHRSPSIASTIVDLESVIGPAPILYGENHIKQDDFRDHIDVAVESSSAQSVVHCDHSVSEVTPAVTTTSVNSGLPKQFSLADQYLDTMIMDDFWRAACINQIRQNQRRQRALKRLEAKQRQTFFSGPSPPSEQPSRQMFCEKSRTISPTPPGSPYVQGSHKTCSPRGSDSGFISFSPTPNPSSYLRVRSTRNCPVSNPSSTISIDMSASMVGRSCLSCRCTTTTCWRRTLGGIICNSCGLRFATPPQTLC